MSICRINAVICNFSFLMQGFGIDIIISIVWFVYTVRNEGWSCFLVHLCLYDHKYNDFLKGSFIFLLYSLIDIGLGRFVTLCCPQSSWMMHSRHGLKLYCIVVFICKQRIVKTFGFFLFSKPTLNVPILCDMWILIKHTFAYNEPLLRESDWSITVTL